MYKNLAVNFHLTTRCNMHCGYCFNRSHATMCATFEQQQKIVAKLCSYGFSKISFVGGEPTLMPHLPALMRRCKELEKTSMLITNGSTLLQRPECLEFCDWVGLSIDSLSDETNVAIGRCLPDGVSYGQIINTIRDAGCRLKINTVVSRLNKDESMSKFIEESGAERWKILQVTKVSGQNDLDFQNYAVSNDSFESFLKRHDRLKGIIAAEYTEDIIDSYLMLDHAGCFISNSENSYLKSSSILEIGVDEAITYANFNYSKHISRSAVYDWS